jgi:hypothetical protein
MCNDKPSNLTARSKTDARSRAVQRGHEPAAETNIQKTMGTSIRHILTDQTMH